MFNKNYYILNFEKQKYKTKITLSALAQLIVQLFRSIYRSTPCSTHNNCLNLQRDTLLIEQAPKYLIIKI